MVNDETTDGIERNERRRVTVGFMVGRGAVAAAGREVLAKEMFKRIILNDDRTERKRADI